MILVRSGSFSGSCVALRSGGNCGREEGASFLIWYDLGVVIPWVVLCGLLTPCFMAGYKSIPDCSFFRRPHGSAVRSLFDVNLSNVDIGSLRGGGVVRRDSGSF